MMSTCLQTFVNACMYMYVCMYVCAYIVMQIPQSIKYCAFFRFIHLVNEFSYRNWGIGASKKLRTTYKEKKINKKKNRNKKKWDYNAKLKSIDHLVQQNSAHSFSTSCTCLMTAKGSKYCFLKITIKYGAFKSILILHTCKFHTTEI